MLRQGQGNCASRVDKGDESVNSVGWCAGKVHAARVLARMVILLANWREVWSSYRVGLPLPPLHFRRGFTLYHGAGDDPIMLLHEVFVRGCYRHYNDKELSGVMLDLGANIGAVSLDWASRSRGVRIHAYEPNPGTWEILWQNVKANGFADRITIHKEAVGRRFGDFRLWTNVHSLLVTGYGEVPPAPGAVAICVPMIDLNEVIRRAGGGPITLLKIDTEGAEADTLEGATPLTLEAIEQVILEYHDGLCPGALSRCRRVLGRSGFNYRIRPVTASQGLVYASRNAF